MITRLPRSPASIARETSRTAVESSRDAATSWTVFFMTKAGAGHTMS